MKKLLALALTLPFAVGCGTFAALRQPFTRTTNAVPVVVTLPGQTNSQAVIVAAATNVLGNVVTITPPYVTNFVTITPASYVTNWATNVSVVVNPALESALATVSTVNRFNPTPSAPFIELAIGGIIGGLGFFARLKAKQAMAAHAEGKESLSIARTCILGIEEAKSAETKAAVEKLSAAVGNAPAVKALVQKLTG